MFWHIILGCWRAVIYEYPLSLPTWNNDKNTFRTLENTCLTHNFKKDCHNLDLAFMKLYICELI